MATYQIQTEGGTYQIETADAQPQQTATAQAAQQYNGQGAPPTVPAPKLPWALDKNVLGNEMQGAPILPSAMAGAAAGMGLLNTIGDRLGMNIADKARAKGGKVEGAPILPRPSGLLVEGQEIPTVGQGLLAKVPDIPKVPKLPSYERAGQNFQAVQQAAGDMPVDVSEAGDHALRIQEMAGRGGSQPKVVRDFVNRATSPNAKPLTYNELRDFASNASRLSADEAGRLTPAMKREMGAFAQSLNKANEGAAEAAGVGDKYRAAMSEYRNAARLNDFKQGVKDAAKSQALKTVGGGLLGYEVFHKMGLL